MSVAARLARLTPKDADRIRRPEDRNDLCIEEGLVLRFERVAVDVEVRKRRPEASRWRTARPDDFPRPRRFQHFTMEHADYSLVNSEAGAS
jgi:hypothetical protein